MRQSSIKLISGMVISLLILLFFILLIAPQSAQAQDFVRFNAPVSDQANVISPEKEAELTKQLVDFNKTTDRQVAVVTIKSLEGRDVDEYTNQYYRFLGVGSKELNDGVLFLIAPTDRKMRIEVGYGLEASLTDAHSGRILEDIKPYFRANDYDGGIQFGVNNILPLVTPQAVEQAHAATAKEAERSAKTREAVGNFFSWVFIVIGSLLSAFGLYWVGTIPSRRRKREEAARLLAEREAQEEADRKEHLAEIAASQAAARARQKIVDAENEKRRDAEAKRIRDAEEKKAREWAEYLKNETPSQKTARLAKEKAEEENRIEAERIAKAAAAAKAIADAETAKARAAQRRKDDEEAAARRRRDDDDYYSRSSSSSSSYGSSSSSSSYGSSSSSDYGSSSSSSSFDFGGGSSGGGGDSSSW